MQFGDAGGKLRDQHNEHTSPTEACVRFVRPGYLGHEKIAETMQVDDRACYEMRLGSPRQSFPLLRSVEKTAQQLFRRMKEAGVHRAYRQPLPTGRIVGRDRACRTLRLLPWLRVHARWVWIGVPRLQLRSMVPLHEQTLSVSRWLRQCSSQSEAPCARQIAVQLFPQESPQACNPTRFSGHLLVAPRHLAAWHLRRLWRWSRTPWAAR